jgi:hypothetical protein
MRFAYCALRVCLDRQLDNALGDRGGVYNASAAEGQAIRILLVYQVADVGG